MSKFFKYSEHLEKYCLLLMSLVGFTGFLHLTYLTFFSKDESMYQTTSFYFFILTGLAIACMVIRKGMKYQIGKDGVTIESEK